MTEIIKRKWCNSTGHLTCADPLAATLGSVQTRVELHRPTEHRKPSEQPNREDQLSEAVSGMVKRTNVEADGALLGGVEARREVFGADEQPEPAGVQVGEMPDQAARLRQPLLHCQTAQPLTHSPPSITPSFSRSPRHRSCKIVTRAP